MEETINKIYKYLPKGWMITLDMECGWALVSLMNDNGDFINLDDNADKTIVEQLNNALAVAIGQKGI